MKRFLLSIFLFLGILSFAPAVQAQTDPFNRPTNPESVCQKPSAASSTICQTTGRNPISGEGGILMKATRIVAIVAGVVAVIMVLIGSFLFVTAGDDTGKAKSARKIIIGALIGLVIVALAQTIVSLVIRRLL